MLNTIEIFVYTFSIDSTSNLWPNFLIKLLTIYNPIPVDFVLFLPFEPVNDLLNIFLISFLGIPIPLS